MQRLDFKNYTFRYRQSGDRIAVFDEIRKKFLILTPEEWVRQHVLHFLLYEKGYPKSLVNVEKSLSLNGLSKRYDVVVFKPDGQIAILVECKAPHVKITQSVFDQIARYNLGMQADLLMVTNGLHHFYCAMDYHKETYVFLHGLPDYSRGSATSANLNATK